MVSEKTSWHCFYYARTPHWTNSSVALELGKIIKAVRGWNDRAAAQEPRGPAKNFAAGSQLGVRPMASESACHPTAAWKTLHYVFGKLLSLHRSKKAVSILHQNQLTQAEGYLPGEG